jgi:hypothetical protein
VSDRVDEYLQCCVAVVSPYHYQLFYSLILTRRDQDHRIKTLAAQIELYNSHLGKDTHSPSVPPNSSHRDQVEHDSQPVKSSYMNPVTSCTTAVSSTQQELAQTSRSSSKPSNPGRQEQIEFSSRPAISTLNKAGEAKTVKQLSITPKPSHNISSEDSFDLTSALLKPNHSAQLGYPANAIQSLFETSATARKAPNPTTPYQPKLDHISISTTRSRIAFGVLISTVSKKLDETTTVGHEGVTINNGSSLASGMFSQTKLDLTNDPTSPRTLMPNTPIQDTTTKLSKEKTNPVSPSKIAHILGGSSVGRQRFARTQRSI